jgi:phosphohistidine phosphatase
MKRRLILMRHAKSAWNTEAPSDHARPLNDRGRRDAPKVAARLVALGWRPGLVLSSDSERTRQTAASFEAAFGSEVEVRFLSKLYLAGVEQVRAEIAELPDTLASALLLGHNPGWEDALAWLSGEPEPLKTANAALLEAENEGATWRELAEAPRRFRLVELVRSRELE